MRRASASGAATFWHARYWPGSDRGTAPLASLLQVASKGKAGDLELKGMSKLIQQLPQYREQLSRLAAHVEIASRLNQLIDVNKLTELGKLEQVCVLCE